MSRDRNPRQVQIHFRNTFSSLPAKRRAAALGAVGVVLDIAPGLFKAHPTNNGQEFDLAVPSNAAERLGTILQGNSGTLRLLGVEKVILETESGGIEQWVAKSGKYQLEVSLPPTCVSTLNAPITGKSHGTFEPAPRIWLFHLAYLLVTLALAASIFSYSQVVSMSLLLISSVCTFGMVLVRLRRLTAAHLLAVAIGLGVPIVVCTRLWPIQTIILFLVLTIGIFLVRRSLF